MEITFIFKTLSCSLNLCLLQVNTANGSFQNKNENPQLDKNQML